MDSEFDPGVMVSYLRAVPCEDLVLTTFDNHSSFLNIETIESNLIEQSLPLRT